MGWTLEMSDNLPDEVEASGGHDAAPPSVLSEPHRPAVPAQIAPSTVPLIPVKLIDGFPPNSSAPSPRLPGFRAARREQPPRAGPRAFTGRAGRCSSMPALR